MRFAILACALAAIVAARLLAQTSGPPMEILNQKAQAGPEAAVHPAPLEIDVKRGPFTLHINRVSPPNSEPGAFELTLTADSGSVSGAVCKVGDDAEHPVDGGGASVTWNESGNSDAPVRVTAGSVVLNASLPGGRKLGSLGAGLPNGLRIDSSYRPVPGATVFRYRLTGDPSTLAGVDTVEYRLPKKQFGGAAPVVSSQAQGFAFEEGTSAPSFTTEVVVKMKDGTTTTMALPFAPPLGK